MDEKYIAEIPENFSVPEVFSNSIEPNATKTLTIKIVGSSSSENGERSMPISPSISISPHLNSPSPPSSAFVSALQSPYISPRALEPPTENSVVPLANGPILVSSSGCHSDDIPSTSYTPTSEGYDFPIDITQQNPKVSDAAAPRISFSFQVPRNSVSKGSVSPSSNNKMRSCDVYIGFHGQSLNLIRLSKWLKCELELHGIASFVADRTKYSDAQCHEIADRIICPAAFGVIVVTPTSFLNPLSIEEIRFFAQKKNLVPLLFHTEISEITRLYDGMVKDKEHTEAFEGLMKYNETMLEANENNWRSCVLKTVKILKAKLGRKSISGKKGEVFEELPFPRNRQFVGREKELLEIEAAFFGCGDVHEMECSKAAQPKYSSSDGLADEDSDAFRTNERFISLEMRKSKEPTLEAWIEPVTERSRERSLQKQRSKQRKLRTGGNKAYGNCSVFCINGVSGMGKTELALEFAYRYSQRYKMVLWVGGEARYFRQNILNLSMNLGLDVSVEMDKEHGRFKSFDEQEFDAFQRVKRELFRDVPYLLVIDNLETEKDWWEGKDLQDFIPRNTGATHVIITTRLSKVMSFEPMQLQPFSLSDSLLLMKGRRKKDYSSEELEVLKKFDERLGRLSFGLSLIGSLLYELSVSPSELFDAIDRISLNDANFLLGISEVGFSPSNFLMKLMVFCFALLERSKGRSLALRMALVGSWFASAPVSSAVLLAAANKLLAEASSFQQLGKSRSMTFFCGSFCLAQQARRTEIESALMLIKLGMAKRSMRQPGCWIQFHPITQVFARRRGGLPPAKAIVLGARKTGSPALNLDHLWASAFLVFGFKSEPPLVQLRPEDMVLFIQRTAIPLAIGSFMNFSRCNSALELLKVCTNVLEEVEKSFVSQIQDLNHRSFCWKKLQTNRRVDEYTWQDVTLLKATLLETRAKLLMRGGLFDHGEELCRTCISIRTVMLGHNHPHTLAAQGTLTKLVRSRSKI